MRTSGQKDYECLIHNKIDCEYTADVVSYIFLLILLFNTYLCLSAIEDQGSQWGEKDNFAIKPKSKGSGIMISDFIDEVNGYLQLSDTEYSLAKDKYGNNIKKEAREYLEYGESREGYWTSNKFLAQCSKNC